MARCAELNGFAGGRTTPCSFLDQIFDALLLGDRQSIRAKKQKNCQADHAEKVLQKVGRERNKGIFSPCFFKAFKDIVPGKRGSLPS
jgi:hypothetical protein